MRKAQSPLTLSENLTCGLLASRITDLGLSPEALANRTPISNMTIRRLLKMPRTTPVPEKYSAHLVPALLNSAFSQASSHVSTDSIYEIVGQLHIDGKKVQNIKSLKVALNAKFKGAGSELKNLAVSLWRHASARATKQTFVSRSIAIGAILYFINPFDLIPDSIPVFGYLDDFAVMTLALAQINKLSGRDVTTAGRGLKTNTRKAKKGRTR